MGAFDEPDLTCLPIENTHVSGYNEYPFINSTYVSLSRNVFSTQVEKYVVLLFSAVDPHIHSLCHYLPLEWLNKSRAWPPGEYLLPIGKRGQQLPSILEGGLYAERTKFSCPTGFQRLLHEYEVYDEEFEASTATEMTDVGSSKVMLHFCQRTNEMAKEGDKNKTASWPKGDYCVIVNGATCPPEMRK